VLSLNTSEFNVQCRRLSGCLHYQVNIAFELFIAGNPEQFYYLNQGMSPVVQSIDDAEDLTSVRQALTLLGESHVRHTVCVHCSETFSMKCLMSVNFVLTGCIQYKAIQLITTV